MTNDKTNVKFVIAYDHNFRLGDFSCCSCIKNQDTVILVGDFLLDSCKNQSTCRDQPQELKLVLKSAMRGN
jgi:hypothetical protein